MVYTLTVKELLPGRGPKDESGNPTNLYVERKDLSKRVYVEQDFLAPSEVLCAGKALLAERVPGDYIVKSTNLLTRKEVTAIVLAKKYLGGRTL